MTTHEAARVKLTAHRRIAPARSCLMFPRDVRCPRSPVQESRDRDPPRREPVRHEISPIYDSRPRRLEELRTHTMPHCTFHRRVRADDRVHDWSP